MKRRMSPWGAGFGSGRSSDGVAMASGPPEVTASQEPAEAVEECSGKKKSKFQTLKKFFARKKRKEPPAAGADAWLKASQSTDDVSKTSENNTLTRSEKEKGSGSKISLGSKALSHDSVFVSDSSEANEALGASQDSIHGKVKSIQLQLKQAIRLGSPPSLMCVKRTEDAGTMSEDDGLPCSPPEYTAHHAVTKKAQRNSSISLEGLESDDDQLSSRAVSPLVVPGDFSQPASPFGCLDNSAAKHKLGLRYKACNKRKPISRLEVKAEVDSAVERRLDTSAMEDLEAQEKTTEVVNVDELKPNVEEEEEELDDGEEEKEKTEEEEIEEKEQPRPSTKSLLRDKEEREEEKSDAGQDVSHDPDASSPTELCLSEEEAPDARPPPSSETSSRTSSLDSPRTTPEPPAGPREYLLDPPSITYGAAENKVENDQREERNEVRDHREEENSFLQEVLSSLKTPLDSCSLGMETEGADQEIKEEVKKKEREAVEIDECEEVTGEELEEEEPVSYQAPPPDTLLSEESTEREEEVVASIQRASWQDVEEDEKVDNEAEEAVEEEEEEEQTVVEQIGQLDQKDEGEEGRTEEVSPEEHNDLIRGNSVTRAEDEGRGEEEEEEEAEELDKEPELAEEGQEEWEEEEVEVEEGVAVLEEEKKDTEEMMEVAPRTADKEAKMPQPEVDESADGGIAEDAGSVPDIPTELGVEVLAEVHDREAASSQSSGLEREDENEGAVEGQKIDHTVDKSEQEDEGTTNQHDGDQTEPNAEQDDIEASLLDTKQVEEDQTHVPSKPLPLSLPESHDEMQSQESGPISPSKTRTTTVHINLLSPSSEKGASFFQQSPTAAYPKESETPSHALESTKQEAADTVEPEEEEKQSAVEDKTTPPVSVEDAVNQLSSHSDQSKVNFTIASLRQRSLSREEAGLTTPSCPPAGISSSSSSVAEPGDVEAATKKDHEANVEPVSLGKAELVLSPGQGRNAGSTSIKPQSNATLLPSPTRPQTSTAATTEESSVIVEGNPDNPFGVRLRKTSALHRFSSEEENVEPPVEPSAQVSSPQPTSIKPSVSQPPSNKPALPKKPDIHVDSAGKSKRVSDPVSARGVPGGSDSPSWISVAKQKQKIYKENSLEEITVKKEEQERKSSLPAYVSSAASKDNSSKTTEPTSKVSVLETSKPPGSVEETRRSLSPPSPVHPQPPKSQSPPCPVPPKPQVPPAAAKHPQQKFLSPLNPVPVPQKSPSYTNPPCLSKTATQTKTPQTQSTTVTSPPFSSRTSLDKSGSKGSGLPSQTPSSPRGLPPPALPQDEPPWMALAKKKAKAWSEMPQIVQ